MFLAHKPGAPARAIESEADAHGVAWIDLLNPTPEEQDLAARICGQPLPTLDDLNEIESSSRISVRNGAAFLSTPLLKKTGLEFEAFPVGFVLTAERLITIRYQPYPSFESVAQLVADHTLPPSPAATPAPSTVVTPGRSRKKPHHPTPRHNNSRSRSRKLWYPPPLAPARFWWP
nr:CorA family divalent cation transporter [Acetobacter persici]